MRALYVGVRLWQGAELWFDPEIDQGMGLAQTHGVAGFPSAESYKLGFDYPYARMQRAFVRQTIDLGGEPEKVEADINQFAGSRTADRLVLTVGMFSIAVIGHLNVEIGQVREAGAKCDRSCATSGGTIIGQQPPRKFQ